jgi:hypothetical protein
MVFSFLTRAIGGQPRTAFVDELDRPLVRYSEHGGSSMRDFFEHIQVFGKSGSGKTSASGKAHAMALLRSGAGGVVVVVKPDEAQLWADYCREAGRESSLVMFNEYAGFNFLNWEALRQGPNAIAGIVDYLIHILDIAKGGQAVSKEDGGADFFKSAAAQRLRYVIPALYSAYGEVTLAGVLQFLTSTPSSPKDVDPAAPERAAFHALSFMSQTLQRMASNPAIPLSVGDQNNIMRYWRDEFPRGAAKTEANVLMTVSATLDRFMHGRLRDMFCGQTTIVPELTFAGAVIVLNMPIMNWGADGRIAQLVFKYAFQRAVMARNALAERFRDRPVFLWADESQYIVTPDDPMFLSTARGCRASVVYLTQNLPNYIEQIGGASPRDAAMAMLGNFGTKIFHANGCADTNTYASELIGRSLQWRRNVGQNEGWNTSDGFNMGRNVGTNVSSSVSHSERGGSTSSTSFGSSAGSSWGISMSSGRSGGRSSGMSEVMDYAVQPSLFAQLRQGGPKNRGEVDAILHRASSGFRNGSNVLPVIFKQ